MRVRSKRQTRISGFHGTDVPPTLKNTERPFERVVLLRTDGQALPARHLRWPDSSVSIPLEMGATRSTTQGGSLSRQSHG